MVLSAGSAGAGKKKTATPLESPAPTRRPFRYRKTGRNARMIVEEEDAEAAPDGALEAKESDPTGPLFPSRESALAAMEESDSEIDWNSQAAPAGHIRVDSSTLMYLGTSCFPLIHTSKRYTN